MLALALASASFAVSGWAEPKGIPGPFFEPGQPFFQSVVEVAPGPAPGREAEGNFVVRGMLLPLPGGYCAVFDQELLRVAGVWTVPPGGDLVTLKGMAQASYADGRRKAHADHPAPSGPVRWSMAMLPGVAATEEGLRRDPRAPARPGEAGRGPLPADLGRFEGIELAGPRAVLDYQMGDARIREWMEAQGEGGAAVLVRHLLISPHRAPVWFALGEGRSAAAPAGDVRRYRIILPLGGPGLAARFDAETDEGAFPPAPASFSRRWPEALWTQGHLGLSERDGWIVDRIDLPQDNPWHRRVRVADIAPVTADRAAVLTFDGDVWWLDGLADPSWRRLRWTRYVSGLEEPLAIAAPGGIVQVATKNGVVRLFDRDGDGRADWIQNFNDQMIQSQATRSFPLDMAVGPDGSTYVTQGGIVDRSGLKVGGEGTPDSGAVMRISPDGRSSERLAAAAREPFVAVDPRSGMVTASDQQGNYIPSSVCYLVRRGDNFGFPELHPAKLTPPLVWIPYEDDNSSSSELWIRGHGLGPWDGRLVHLSYGTGRMFLVTPDVDAPTPQGAAIPLDLPTNVPLLHARMDAAAAAVYLVGFQIWGTRTGMETALERLRPGTSPIPHAIAARSCQNGVILEFAAPLDPGSVAPERVTATAWNYRRSAAYGSGRYALDGSAGVTPLGIAQTVLSTDRRSVFIHVPALGAAMQLEVRHDFAFVGGGAAKAVAYFTIHAPHRVDLAAAGFPAVDLSRTAAAPARLVDGPPSAAKGQALSQRMGCVACHSADGNDVGRIGPTWRGLYGAALHFADGSSGVADELYLREKVLDPSQHRLKVSQVEMPSYRGVLDETELESLVLYIKSLSRIAPR